MDYSAMDWLLPAKPIQISTFCSDLITAESIHKINGLSFTESQARKLAKAVKKSEQNNAVPKVKICDPYGL